MEIADTCILEDRIGRKFLFSRWIDYNQRNGQVHDGTSIVAELQPVVMGKRGQNWHVKTYEPQTTPHQRGVVTSSYHGTKEAAVKKMERLAIQQFMERHEPTTRPTVLKHAEV